MDTFTCPSLGPLVPPFLISGDILHIVKAKVMCILYEKELKPLHFPWFCREALAEERLSIKEM